MKYRAPERRLVVVIAAYNNAEWCNINLCSVFSQNYSNYRVIYVDDCSTDGTFELASSLIQGHEHRITLIQNRSRRRALENYYRAITACDDNEIVLILDGDDWLAHPEVMNRINDTYLDGNVWLTWSQNLVHPVGELGFCRAIPRGIIDSHAFRSFTYVASHLRTFYAGLFKKIRQDDLMEGEVFFDYTYDIAIMLPMLEMAGHHIRFLDEVLYVYNEANPLNDHKVSRTRQVEVEEMIRRRPQYQRLYRNRLLQG